MTLTNPTITAAQMHTASAGAGAAVAFTAAGHSTLACVALVTLIAVSAVIRVAREWFWHRALNGPARYLFRVHRLTGGSTADTERLMRVVLEGESKVLTARIAADHGTGRHPSMATTPSAGLPVSDGIAAVNPGRLAQPGRMQYIALPTPPASLVGSQLRIPGNQDQDAIPGHPKTGHP
jgi:hypothetical protein